MITLPGNLKEMFGAQFPNASEIDHLMAVRGLLFSWLGRSGTSSHARERLKEAIDMVGEELSAGWKTSPKDERHAPSDLFSHYREVVAWNWRWLYSLQSLIPSE